MIKYDGAFQITDKMSTLFATMGLDKQRWMDGYLVPVDCVYMALSKGGKVNKNVVVVEWDVLWSVCWFYRWRLLLNRVCSRINELIMYLDIMKDVGTP